VLRAVKQKQTNAGTVFSRSRAASLKKYNQFDRDSEDGDMEKLSQRRQSVAMMGMEEESPEYVVCIAFDPSQSS